MRWRITIEKNRVLFSMIMAWGLQLGESEEVVRMVMEAIVPQEFIVDILERSILRLGINSCNVPIFSRFL